ncbi:MAG: pseudaminic acid biosynthesis-associated methylase [Gloeotrichia echinulata IR180]
MQEFETVQEQFWAGDFGNEYVNRNQEDVLVANNIALFAKIFAETKNVKSLIEFGANIGLNLQAIKQLIPQIEISAVEINQQAFQALQELKYVNSYQDSILKFTTNNKYDFVLVKGVLIHINPDKLAQVYELLYTVTSRYICIAEYYNPKPVEVTYRGHQDKLFKRDFAGDMLERFKDLQLKNYGFVYHRDSQFPQDDLTWFLLKKTV